MPAQGKEVAAAAALTRHTHGVHVSRAAERLEGAGLPLEDEARTGGLFQSACRAPVTSVERGRERR